LFHKGYSEPSKRVRQTSAERSEAQTSEILAKGHSAFSLEKAKED